MNTYINEAWFQKIKCISSKKKQELQGWRKIDDTCVDQIYLS